MPQALLELGVGEMGDQVLVEGILPGEAFTTGVAEKGIRSDFVDVFNVLTNVFLRHECLVAEWAFLRPVFAADFHVSGEIGAMCITSPAGGALVGLEPVVLVHVTFKLDFMPESPIAYLTYKGELIIMQSNVIL